MLNWLSLWLLTQRHSHFRCCGLSFVFVTSIRHMTSPACRCDERTSARCEMGSGRCICRPQFTGANCDHCADGYYNYPECIRKMFSVFAIGFQRNLPLRLKMMSHFCVACLGINWLTWILFRPPSTFPLVGLAGVSSVLLISRRRARCTCRESTGLFHWTVASSRT